MPSSQEDPPPESAPRCSNCGTEAPGNYCPHCGQPQKERITSAPTLMRDVASNYFTFDARLWRTLKPLLFAPGRLTKEYIRGRRRRYSRPSRVYVAASIVFFFILSVTSTHVIGNFYDPPSAEGAAADSTAHQSAYESSEDSLRAVKMQAAMDSLRKAGIDISSDGVHVEDEESGTSINIEAGNLDKDKILAAFIENLPTLMFVLLPAFAFLLKLFYARRSRFYIEHLVFAFHAHAFAFLLMTLSVVGGQVLPETAADILEGAVALGILVYVYRALRTVYEQSQLKTILKLVLLFFSYSLTLAVGFLATIVITVALMQL